MADIGCTPNASIAFHYFLAKGLGPIQAAAIVGNLQWESHLDPTLEAMDTNNKMSRGIAMWQPPRWAALQAFAAGRDPRSLGVQLDFVWAELPYNGLRQLLAASTLPDAVVAFQNGFEKPLAALAHTDKRIALANNVLTWCPNVVPPPPAPHSSTAAVAAVTVGVLALVATAGYAIYQAATSTPKAPPAPSTPPPRPFYPPRRYPPAVYRPGPFRPPPWEP